MIQNVRHHRLIRTHLGFDVGRRDAFDGSEDVEVLLHSQDVKDDVELRADTHQLLHLRALRHLGHRGAVDGGRAVAGLADATQDVHEGGLARSAVPQQGGDLALVDVKGQPWGQGNEEEGSVSG